MKENKNLIFSGVSALLSLVAFFMFLAPFITLFGGSASGYGVAFNDPFYFGAFFNWLIVTFAMLISLGTCCVELLVKLKVMKPLNLKLSDMVKTLVLGCLAIFDLVVAILLFCTPALCNGADIYGLGAGAIVAAVMMILLFLVKCCYIVLPKVLK